MKQDNRNMFDLVTQFAIPVFTIGGQVVISLKFPLWGLVLLLLAQPFWLYSSWKSYKQAGQIGMFVNTVLFTGITIFGIVNYWFF